MTTLHGSVPSLRRHVEGCIPSEGTIASARDPLNLELHPWRRVGGRLIRADSHQSSDSSVEMSDELASTLASIQEFMAGVSRRLDQIESSRQDHPIEQVLPPRTSHGVPFHLSDHCETAPPPAATVSPPIVTTTDDTRLIEQEARVERLEARMRQIRLQDGGLTWDDRDGIPAAILLAKFHMPNMEPYTGIGCPKIHLRLYSTVMRAHGIDGAHLVALFPLSLSGVAQRWFASVEPSRLRTWEDVAHEFLTQFASSADIDVSRRELEATRQRPDESISSFVSRWRAKVAGMIDRPKEQDQIDMVLRNLQPRFARRLAAFSVEEAIARGLWTDITPSPDSKGKKSIGSFSRSGEVGAISYQHRRLAHHSPYGPPPVRAHFPHPRYQYQPDYVQEPYIAQTSMQPRPPHPRAATHPPPRPYGQRPASQFTPLGMTLTRAFEKLRDVGLIVPLAPRPLPPSISPHFRLHEHCLYHQIQGHDTERCSALHHAIQDLIDSGLVNLSGPSVTSNPLPTHSTHAVAPPPSLQ
ncbi:hypothetical protein PVL29_019589 [Vitis rotundifolia]|uniref:Retrotransposon gag domain-containing protein n=1 Tax=Vitis rotundifolia TaxID=103349 RepID=A0AA39DFJ0_VITRO|nr:hypothetical protein PVL29_019589 [Vitis rotundifolia]